MQMSLGGFHCATLLGLLCLLAAIQQANAASPPEARAAVGSAQNGQELREITNVTGQLFRFRDGGTATPVLVTPAGIILGDPISLESATWLKAELKRRFDVPVRYVVYSHCHWDHASGAAAFHDTAKIIAHQNTPACIKAYAARLRTSQYLADQRGNRNGTIEKDEAHGAMLSRFAIQDRNGDGSVTAKEAMADVIPPDSTYVDKFALTLGGKTVVLIHPGDNHSIDSTVMLFPDERVLFGADFFSVKRLPNDLLGEVPLGRWIESFMMMESLDFDVLFPAHGALGVKADLIQQRTYFEALNAAIKDGIAAGKSLEQIQASDALTSFKDVPGYGSLRNQNLEQAFNIAMVNAKQN